MLCNYYKLFRDFIKYKNYFHPVIYIGLFIAFSIIPNSGKLSVV